MKKITSTCLVLLGMLSGYTNYAQGFLDKIKEGAGNSLGVSLVGAAKVSAKDQKKADEDAANPLLDGKSIKTDAKIDFTAKGYSSYINPRTTKTIDVGVGLMKASNGWSMDLTKSHDGQTFIIAQ